MPDGPYAEQAVVDLIGSDVGRTELMRAAASLPNTQLREQIYQMLRRHGLYNQ